jgi:hypothetical protein
MLWNSALLACLLFLSPNLQAAEPTGLRESVVFSENSPYSTNVELSRRTLSPITADALFANLAKDHKRMAGQPLVPDQERFILFVPPIMPPEGYGMLVFVGPWELAKLPQGWGDVLDQMGVIYVSAARSGNEQITLARREPLALMAASAVQTLYKVNPAHIFIGGMSGGSRVAERLAVAYPDLFKGALLEAGSDPIGEPGLEIPSKELFGQFQEESRLVFVTGDQDRINRELDQETLGSLASFCVFGTEVQTIPRLGHQIAPPGSLKQALKWLLDPQPIDRSGLEACRARLDSEVKAALDEAHTRSALEKLDAHYGGLAAPQSVDLAHQLSSPP